MITILYSNVSVNANKRDKIENKYPRVQYLSENTYRLFAYLHDKSRLRINHVKYML